MSLMDMIWSGDGIERSVCLFSCCCFCIKLTLGLMVRPSGISRLHIHFTTFLQCSYYSTPITFHSSGTFTDRCKAMPLLWFLFVIYASCLSLLCCLACSLQPCDHLLGKGWPLGSLVCDVFLCFCHFTLWCPGSGVVLDYIDSWSLPSSLFWHPPILSLLHIQKHTET